MLNALRRRVIPWSEIGSIRESHVLGTTYVEAYVPAQRRNWKLRAPTHTPFVAPDPEFRAKVATIVLAWEAHRGPQWAPPNSPSASWQQPVT